MQHALGVEYRAISSQQQTVGPEAGNRHLDGARTERGGVALRIECGVLAQVKEMRAGGFDMMLRVGSPPDTELIACKIASDRLRRVLPGWECVGGPSIYAFYRKSVRTMPKITAFLQFVAESFIDFDPGQLTLTHDPSVVESVRQARR